MIPTESTQPKKSAPCYPDDFLKWAGHRDGGVKKPFQRDTGRPAGVRIVTPLVTRLRDWVENLTKGESVPTTILLVGGPGNGKTDTVEGLIEDLDNALKLNNKLFDAFGDHYTGDNAENPPRRVNIDLEALIPNAPSHLQRTISIVQDATEADPTRHPNMSSQEILLDELEETVDNSKHNIYICCVNRGKLAEAYTKAQSRVTDPRTIKLLTAITTSVTSSPDAKSCWPLQEFPSISAWPMDIDSLVEAHGEQKPALHQMLETALERKFWPDTCAAGDMCPFCENRKQLSKDGALDQLAELLRAFELGTGKRWTFRDLYSLVSYMLVGDEGELTANGKQLAPCDWAAAQLELLDSERTSDEAKRARALYCLVGCLYWHRLFPLWPRLATKDYTDAQSKIIKPLNKDLSYAKDLFRYLAWSGRGKKLESIARLISDKFCSLLDPADSEPDETISKATTHDYTVRDIDEHFSLSTGQGYDIIRRRIPPLERELLKRLQAADDAFGSDAIPSQERGKAELMQRSIRLFSSRLAKRSLGAQNGIYANRENLLYYKKALQDPQTLKKVQNGLKQLINDQKRNLFVIPLMTTFAQPSPPRRRNITLEAPAVRIRAWKTTETERPSPQLVYLQVDKDPVPLTFELFNALEQLGRGMHSGSLSGEVFAMVDRVRARVAGHTVRDQDLFEDDAVMILEPTGEKISFAGNKYIVEEK